MTHIETVQRMYEAFGRGDVPALLEHVADDVEWEYGVNSTDVPWLQPQRGRDGVGQFFQVLGTSLEFHKFQPKQFFSEGHTVVVLVDLEVTVRATGTRIVEEDEAHIFYFNDAGKVIRFRHRVDTHQHVTALRGRS